MKTALFLLSMASVGLCAAKQEAQVAVDKGVRVGIYTEYLAMQPNGSNLYYGAEAIPLAPGLTMPAASPNWKILEIDPGYHFAFDVGIAVLLDNVGINLSTDWQWIHTHDSDSFNTPTDTNMVGPIFDIGPQSANYKKAKGTATYQFDQVNFDCGKQFVAGKWHGSVYGGAGFLRIKEGVKSHFSNASTNIARTVNTSSTFIGAGPQIGFDYDYKICNHLFFVGNSILSLFMGQLSDKLTFVSYTPELSDIGNPNPNRQKTSVPNRAQLVPGWDQKLGFSYVLSFKKAAIAFGLGYQCQIYLNAIQTMDMTAPQVLPEGAAFSSDVGVFAVGFERTLSNFILTGPYAGLDIQF
ncbi:MAG: hypothetical protein RLZZ453_800 [Chlamydiota bacterium]|jgi:hypothetical protein